MRFFYDIDPSDSGGGGSLTPTIANLPTTAVKPIAAPPPTTVGPLPINKSALATPNPRLIPTPNYADPNSRNQYLQSWQKQYGPLEGRGDTVLKVNEVPRGASDTIKNLATKSGKQYGIDPALLYSSMMEEGASGLFKNQSGNKDTKGRSPGQFGYQDLYYDKDFPVSGNNSFGLNTFADRFPDLVKKGLLPAEFAKNFRGAKSENIDQDLGRDDFKDTNSAVQATAALLKNHYDDIDSYAKQRGIKLSPKARDFFALADFNGGEGSGHKMLNDYYNNGYLENDKFLEKRPTSGKGLTASSYGPTQLGNEGMYNHIARRLKMASALKEQGLF
jgi:hypothetical protein